MDSATTARIRPTIVSNRARPGIDKPFAEYHLGAPWDEMFTSDGAPRAHASALYDALTTLASDELLHRQQSCEQSFLHQGITFTVYGHQEATEKIIPTDLLPRIVPGAEWTSWSKGCGSAYAR